MFVLTVIPLLFGYLLVTRVVGDREGHLRLPLTYGLGLTCFLFGVNAFFHLLTLRAAVFLTLGLMVVTSVALWRLKANAAIWPRLGRLEAAVIITLTLTAFLRALFWQMKHSDDDFFPHASLMALYLRDIFPPRNPFYPDQPYLGHYGRDLSISALSVLWGERFLAVQYVVTALNHAMTVLLVYFASRRFLRSRRQALLAVSLVFLGVNMYWHRSLLDVFSNNNTFVHLFLFVNCYLFLSVLRRPRPGLSLLTLLCLATYSIVYTTHHGVLLWAFSLLVVVMVIRSRRWRALRLMTAGTILAGSLVISLVHGGTLTDVGQRYLFGTRPRAGAAEEVAEFTQRATIQFPKGRLGFTAWDGTPYPLFGLRFLQEAGFSVALLPATLVILVAKRRFWALLLALIAAVAVLLPATVNFGLFENDSYRFLFLAGIGAAMALGVSMGMGLDNLARGGQLPRWATAVTAGVLALSCSGSLAGTVSAFADVARRAEEYRWSAAEWACNGIHRDACDPIDVRTALAMRPLVGSGDSILTNVYDESDREFIAHSVIGAFARGFVTGHGVRISRNPDAEAGRLTREQAGFRAIAFWATGATELLADMRVDWLLVDRSRLSQRVRESLASNPHLRLVHREQDAASGGVRDVYRFERSRPLSAVSLPADLTLVSADLPPRMGRGWFAEVPFVVTTKHPASRDRISIAYLVRTGVVLVNAHDRVRHEVQLRPAGGNRWTGTLLFVSPFNPGEYEVEITAGPADTPLPGPRETPLTLRIRVR